MMIWYGGAGSWWAYAAMGVGMVVFWTLLLGGIFLIVRTVVTTTSQPAPPMSAEQIFSARYAHGEITEAEYQNRLAALRH